MPTKTTNISYQSSSSSKRCSSGEKPKRKVIQSPGPMKSINNGTMFTLKCSTRKMAYLRKVTTACPLYLCITHNIKWWRHSMRRWNIWMPKPTLSKHYWVMRRWKSGEVQNKFYSYGHIIIMFVAIFQFCKIYYYN